jgi:hypothetical protein
MKNRITTAIGVCFVVFGLAQCSQTTNETTTNTKSKDAPQMYEQSELAALMHEVHDLSAEWKTQLENGEPLTPMPEWVTDMLSAEATNPTELEGGAYTPLAEDYIRKLEKLASAEEEGRVDAFNESIQTCISCHKIYCNGPIPKIKKLKI